MPELPILAIPPAPPPNLDALARAQVVLHHWQERKRSLVHLNFPDQVVVAQVDSKIIEAQADVDAARAALVGTLPTEDPDGLGIG